MSLASVQEKIGYRFREDALLRLALTHPSAARNGDYQRLEFLGDAVLELCVSERLYQHPKTFDEGEMTRIRAALVNEKSLAAAARRFELGSEILLDHGAEISGGRENSSILCDVCEAVLGAVFLDGGMDSARALATALLPSLEPESTIDPKTALQEALAAKNLPAPVYEILSSEGPPHNPMFTAAVSVNGIVRGKGTANSKKAAEKIAASIALHSLETGKS